MNIGVAKSAVNPPVGTELTGYAGRSGPATRVHDDISARAIVMEDNGTLAAILTLDVLGLDRNQVALVREKAASMCSVPAENIMICCSHTHSGPATQLLRHCGTADPSYLEALYKGAAETIARAATNMAPVSSIDFGSAECRMGVNRRLISETGEMLLDVNENGITDDSLCAISFKNDNRHPVATLFNYACHGVCLEPDNLEFSADWIWAARANIESSTGAQAMFLQGCCGDINPRIRGTYEKTSYTGEQVASSVSSAMRSPMVIENMNLRVASSRIHLPLQPLPTKEKLKAMEAILLAEINEAHAKGQPEPTLDWAKAQLDWCREAMARHEQQSASTEIEIQAIAIGPVSIVAIPGEAFTELGLNIKSLGQSVIVSAYSNGNIGYIPTEAAFAEGGYEIEHAYKLYGLQMINAESERLIVEAAKNVLAELQ